MAERMSDDTPPVRRRRLLRTIGVGAVGGVTPAVGLARGDSERRNGSGRGNGSENGSGCAGKRTSDDSLPFDTAGAYGGWGGHEFHGTEPGRNHNPVVFVHGNSRDACDFSKHADAFRERDYLGDSLWSITFRESTSTHPEMRDQLDQFVAEVLSYTGAAAVDVVAHSLGVTGARFWMAERDRYDQVDTFVGLAGANHGTGTCPTCDPYPGTGEPCQFISPACADEPGEPLYELNHPDETPGVVSYYTVRGTADVFFPVDQDSPRLDGALRNVVLDGATHDEVRESDRSVGLQYQWVTE